MEALGPVKAVDGIPKGWALARVADVLDLQNGFAFKPAQWKRSGTPIIRIQNLNDREAPFNYCDEELPSRFRVTHGDLLFAWSGTPGTSFGAHIWSGSTAWLNQHIFRVVFDEQFIDKRFLRLAINRNLDDYIHQAHGGAGLAHITKGMFEESLLLLPCLAEQKRIISKVEEVLARVDAARERLAKVPTILKRFRQAVLAAACSGRLTADWRERHPDVEPVDSSYLRLRNQRVAEHETAVAAARSRAERAPRRPAYLEDVEEDGIDLPSIPELPESWKLLRVQDAAVVMQYGTSVKADATADKGVPMLRMSNVQDGLIDLSDLKYMDPKADDVESFLLHRGDIVFNRTNSPELVGKSGVFDIERRVVFASYLIRLKCDPRLIEGDFVCNWINSLWGRQWARVVRTDGVSQSNINATKLGAMPLPVPPLEEQVVIGQRVRQMFELADKIEKGVSSGTLRAEKLVQATLAKAFRGELVPTEAELAEQEGREYETAQALLDRIRRQRESDGMAIEARPRRRTASTPSPDTKYPNTLFEESEADPAEASGTPSGATRSSRTTSGSSSRPSGSQNGSGEDWVDISYDDAMGYVRDAFAEGGARDREQAIHDVAVALGYQRVGSRVRETVDGYIRAAVRRGILGNENGQYTLLVRTAADYSRDHLIDRLIASLNGGWVDREEAVRATAKHLGFQKAGPAFKEQMKSAINGAIRRGLIEYEGEMIRKT